MSQSGKPNWNQSDYDRNHSNRSESNTGNPIGMISIVNHSDHDRNHFDQNQSDRVSRTGFHPIEIISTGFSGLVHSPGLDSNRSKSSRSAPSGESTTHALEINYPLPGSTIHSPKASHAPFGVHYPPPGGQSPTPWRPTFHLSRVKHPLLASITHSTGVNQIDYPLPRGSTF